LVKEGGGNDGIQQSTTNGKKEKAQKTKKDKKNGNTTLLGSGDLTFEGAYPSTKVMPKANGSK